jgi:4-carboxymuconolactone decarboxylase
MMKRKMNLILLLLLSLSSAVMGQTNNQDSADPSPYKMTSITEKGSKVPSENFTGTVWVNMAVGPDDNYNMVAGKVIFEPTARTNWHSHDNGQVLIVTEGVGYYQEEGNPIEVIREGDVVKIPKKVKHWHGASHNSSMAHIAIVTEIDQYTATDWMEPVTDEEYNSFEGGSNFMNITETAAENYNELWPGNEPGLEDTYPELAEIYKNFTFDDVATIGNVDNKTKAMVIMASSIANHALSNYKKFVNAALNVGVSPVEIKEVLYQSVPYVGMAKAIDFVNATNEVMKERGVEVPVEGQSTTDRENRFEKGLAVQKAIFGEQIDQMRKNAPEGQEHIQDYLSANCFGDYYTRTGLDIKTRELLTYSMLISMGGTESQVKGHIQGNLNVGNDKETLVSITTQLLPYIGYPRTLNALKSINEIIPK